MPTIGQTHLNSSLQQPAHLPPSVDIDDHLGNYPNLGSIVPTTSLAGLDMTSRFDNIVTKTEQGIMTMAGVSLALHLMFLQNLAHLILRR